MRSRDLTWIAVAGLTLGACSTGSKVTGFDGAGGSATGAGGATTTPDAASGAGGATATGGLSGSGGAVVTGGGGATGTGGTTGTGGAGGDAVAMSPGCGMTPPAPASMIGTTRYGKFTIDITAQSVLQFNAQPGMNRPVTRQYFVRLPDNYVNTQPYRVIYLGPGCSPAQDSVNTPIRQPPLDTDPNSTGALTGAIIVQLQQGTYNPAAYNPTGCTVANMSMCNANSAYCFDDWASEVGTPQVPSIPDGPPSGAVAMERAYFDALHKAIEAKYCVDKSRQFYAGYSSGGWLAQQLGCWFPDVLRAQANVTGGIPPIINTNATGANNYCVKHPLGYFSIHNNPDASNGFQGSVDAARRVFALNGCTGTFQAPPLPGATTIPPGLEVFQIANAAGRVLVPNTGAFRCYRYTGCPATAPMNFCVSTDSGHDPQGTRAAPAFWEFFSRF